MLRKRAVIVGIFVFSILLVSLFSGIGSAQGYGGYGGYGGGLGFGAEGFLDSITRTFEPLLIALFGGYDYTGYLLFEKLLLFILITIFVSFALKNVPALSDQKKIVNLIAIIVAILGIRNISYFWLNSIFVQYNVVFIAIAGLLPIAIYFFFLHGFDSHSIRIIGWITYIVIYLGLWITSDLKFQSIVFLLAAGLAFIFMLFDGTLHVYYLMRRIKRGGSTNRTQAIGKIRTEMRDLDTMHRDGHITDQMYNDAKKVMEKNLKYLLKHG
jgi:hypothetical protein